MIYAFDEGVRVEIGRLTGDDGIYAFTEIVLGANLHDEVMEGLELFTDIDQNDEGWLVTPGKSVLATDGAAPPPPEPGVSPVPVPAGFLLVAGLAGLAGLRRRKAA